jgi:CheY-like chemotaxis protein
VETAATGPEALERLRTTRYAGIILDLELPGLDGYAIAQRARQLEPNKQTPIVLVTGTPGREAVRRGFDAGAVFFLAKPFTASTFRSTTQSLIA